MSSGISRDEWLQAIAEAGQDRRVDDRDALTLTEFAEMLGVAAPTASFRIQKLVAAGQVEITAKWIINRRGHRTHARAYRLIKKETKRSRKKSAT